MANQLTQIRGDRSVVVNISDGITRADSGDIARSFIGNDDGAQSRSQLQNTSVGGHSLATLGIGAAGGFAFFQAASSLMQLAGGAAVLFAGYLYLQRGKAGKS